MDTERLAAIVAAAAIFLAVVAPTLVIGLDDRAPWRGLLARFRTGADSDRPRQNVA